jgi:sigma-B regulation protein RsbU (phosphoserine phosphatase)
MQTRCLSHTHYMCVPEAPASDVGSAMAVPLACQSGNVGMLYVENAPKDPLYDEETLKVFSATACCAALPVENVLRKATAKHRQAVATQQTVARFTQDALTPKALPEWDDLQVAAYRHMGSARCCDFYDVVQLRDRRASIIVARLTVENAALPRYFAELRATFRAAALYSEPPHLFARALNWIIYDGTAGRAIDLASIWVAPASGKVQYCIAGTGVRLGRIHSDGTCQALETNAGPPVGQTRGPTFAPQALDLPEGDTLVLATAGVDTATNADGQVLGQSGLEENLCDGLGDTPGHVLSEFATDLAEYIARGDCTDDLTVVLLQRR